MTRRVALLEVVRALAVLAIVFLNFAHVPVASASPYGAWAVTDAGSYCGDPLEDGKTQHAPCHACRVGGGADLPPPCPELVPPLSASVLRYVVPTVPTTLTRAPAAVFARGPPAV